MREGKPNKIRTVSAFAHVVAVRSNSAMLEGKAMRLGSEPSRRLKCIEGGC